jgi:hypothetical protein
VNPKIAPTNRRLQSNAHLLGDASNVTTVPGNFGACGGYPSYPLQLAGRQRQAQSFIEQLFDPRITASRAYQAQDHEGWQSLRDRQAVPLNQPGGQLRSFVPTTCVELEVRGVGSDVREAVVDLVHLAVFASLRHIPIGQFPNVLAD